MGLVLTWRPVGRPFCSDAQLPVTLVCFLAVTRPGRAVTLCVLPDRPTAARSCGPASGSSCAARPCSTWGSPARGLAPASHPSPQWCATCSMTATPSPSRARSCCGSLPPSSGTVAPGGLCARARPPPPAAGDALRQLGHTLGPGRSLEQRSQDSPGRRRFDPPVGPPSSVFWVRGLVPQGDSRARGAGPQAVGGRAVQAGVWEAVGSAVGLESVTGAA